MFYIAAGVVNHTQNVADVNELNNGPKLSSTAQKQPPVCISMPSMFLEQEKFPAKDRMDPSIILTPKHLQNTRSWLQILDDMEKKCHPSEIAFRSVYSDRSMYVWP